MAVLNGGSLPANAAPQATDVTIMLDLKHPGTVLPEEFVGLSFEATRLLPGVQDREPTSLWVTPTDAHPNKLAAEAYGPEIAGALKANFPALFPPS